MGQSVTENEKIDPKSYMPGRTAIINAVKDLSDRYRQNFIKEQEKESLQYGGAIKIDGVHLKFQGRQCRDFTLYFMEISTNGTFGKAEFKVRNTTLLLVEGSYAPTPQNIKSCLNGALIGKYELLLDQFFRDIAIVTEGAAVMARVANLPV